MTELLTDAGLSKDFATFLTHLITAGAVATVFLLVPIFTIWLERKVSARMQDRLGPNRVGPYGLLQTIADVLKLMTKEAITPANADKVVFFIAPILMVMSVVLIVAVIPYGENFAPTDLSIGVLYVIAISSLGTIAILMAGWGSNNKYALLGAFRVMAQLVSYEVPMVLALLVPVMLAGTMRMNGIIEAQDSIWFIFVVPVSALIFFVSATAEVGRQPFDLLEAESEIVAGFNIEYGGMQFAMLYLGEWLHAVLICVITAILFLGGWDGPGAKDALLTLPIIDLELPVLGIFYLAAKSFLIYFLHMWVRFTVPRLRIDHLMGFNWKFLVPVGVFNLLVVAFAWKIMPEPDSSSLGDELPRALVVLASNVLFVMLIFFVIRDYARRERAKVEALVDETVYAAASAGD
ncbi:MAG: NADH-quinone oxidoreductase subunit NuoH [Anaerolineae bacterium]|nr:MAG: NADH-quinone oxidoreductase subunit NuoH [Anaerolineae bacterium]